MKKNLVTKVLGALIISITFLIFITNYNVEATSSILNETLEAEEKIMEYDAITGETREVDMKELRQIIATQNNMNENGDNSCSSYNTNLSKIELEPLAPSEIIDRVIDTSSSQTELEPLASSEIVDRVTNTSSFPYRATCRTKSNTSSGDTRYGTAAIVGPKVALTAAHCVFDMDDGDAKLLNWVVYPGYNDGSYYVGSCGWTKVYYSNNWKSTHDKQYDWAICVLGEDLGSKTGCFGLTNYDSDSELKNLPVRVLGYPGDKNYGFFSDARYQYQSHGDISSVFTNYFEYSSWVFGGFSGGPIMNTSNNFIVGVHRGHLNNGKAIGVRISKDMITLIQELREL